MDMLRIDNTGPLAIQVDLFDTASTTTDVSLDTTTKSRSLPEPHSLMIQKFQILPIDVTTTTTIPHRMIGGSGTGVHPPSLLDGVVSAICTDAEAIDACVKFAQDCQLLGEPACGAALAVL
jgi:hypothetical protein